MLSAAGGRNQNTRRSLMSVSTKALLAAGTAVLIGLSTAAMAQSKKSTPATTIGEGEAIMVSPKTGTVHKSNSKVSAAKHTAAMGKGAKEVPGGTVIYKQGGKLYMMQDNANEKASQHFEDNFDVDY
jgi:hypothetical protein